MLRVNRIDQEAIVTCKLEGKLLGPWVGEAARLLVDVPNSTPLHLDLAGVSFVDAAGADLLRELIRRGAVIVACSSFVAELLSTEAR
jgi:hypothetical protein